MIEEDERTLDYLEELDNNFSKINRTLREIDKRLCEILKVNKSVLEDYNPISRFFSIAKENESSVNSSFIMKTHAPKDPFDEPSCTGESVKEESSLVDDMKMYSDYYNDESTSSEIVEFSKSKIPEAFKNETELIDIYEFIATNKYTTIDNLIDYFSFIEQENIVIFLNLLKSKNFIKKKGTAYYVE